jgi:hypothetical protein
MLERKSGENSGAEAPRRLKSLRKNDSIGQESIWLSEFCAGFGPAPGAP